MRTRRKTRNRMAVIVLRIRDQLLRLASELVVGPMLGLTFFRAIADRSAARANLKPNRRGHRFPFLPLPDGVLVLEGVAIRAGFVKRVVDITDGFIPAMIWALLVNWRSQVSPD